MEVRLSHMYLDLTVTDKPIAVLMEENGLNNQKLCNSAFKKLYGCTPSSVRKG
jgi:AraC-like DNA-binding protein